MRMWQAAILALIPSIAAQAQANTPAPAEQCPVAPSAPRTEDSGCFETVPDSELATYRGGFAWKGVQIGLGAEIRTYLNGEQVLQTNISWAPDGAHMSQVVSGSLAAADAAQLQAGILSSGGLQMSVGDHTVFLANEGQTAILHRTDGPLQNVLINRASNITARQEIDAVLDLQNFGQFQEGIATSRIGNALGDMVGQSTIAAFGQ